MKYAMTVILVLMFLIQSRSINRKVFYKLEFWLYEMTNISLFMYGLFQIGDDTARIHNKADLVELSLLALWYSLFDNVYNSLINDKWFGLIRIIILPVAVTIIGYFDLNKGVISCTIFLYFIIFIIFYIRTHGLKSLLW